MARTRPPADRKPRTREHVIADISLNYIERFIVEAGHTSHRWASDYGYDLAMTAFNEGGFAEPGLAFWQLKASESWTRTRGGIPFDLDVRDYNSWMEERLPVILALFDASRKHAWWVHMQGYVEAAGVKPRKDAKTVRIRVPVTQIVGVRAIRLVRRLIAATSGKADWRVS